MLVSSRGRYALRVMIDLAQHADGAWIPLKEIAARQEISLKYLKSIAGVLSRAGLISGRHGKGGGYRLTRPPVDYSVLEILTLTENCLSAVACTCGGRTGCHRAADCAPLHMWMGLNKLIRDYFAGVTLQSLIEEPDSGGGAS